MGVPFDRYDGEVRVTDRVTGASVRAICRAVLAKNVSGDSLVSIEVHTSANEAGVGFPSVEAESVREMRCVLRAFDELLSRLPRTCERDDLHVVIRSWSGPEPCDVFGEVGEEAVDEEAV